MKLEEIGFYTLSDARAVQANERSPLWRGELILTGRCNYRCPYCRHVGGSDLPYALALQAITEWMEQGLKCLRLSGGEPTLYPRLSDLVRAAEGVERIALSTNGSAPLTLYRDLIKAGVNDLSISLDACCAEDGDKMAGEVRGAWETVVANIKALAADVYVTVGVVLTSQNVSRVNETVRLAHNLGVADIRIIPAAQNGDRLTAEIDADLLLAHPILRYRVSNIASGRRVRGLEATDPNRCALVLDDVAAMNGEHYPCVIYLREGGKAIGSLGANMRAERAWWACNHDTHADQICLANCIDVCVEYNRRAAQC